MNTDSDDDEDCPYLLTDPILKLQRKIVERISLYNYLKICVNVGWIVDDALPEDATKTEKINLCVLVLDSIHLLRPLSQYHYSMVENLYSLADNPNRLERLKTKKIGWFQYFMSWIW